MSENPHPRYRRRLLAALAAVPLLLVLFPPLAALAANSVTVYYQPATSWTAVNVHYAPAGSSWTTAPGVAMTADGCAGWFRKEISLGDATGVRLTFNNGSGTWDNNAGNNYLAGTGVVTVAGGTVGSAVPCGTTNTAKIYYRTGWGTTYLHWAPAGGSWTTGPGVVMNETACTGWALKTVSLGSASALQATFTNGSGAWDNNSGQNYRVGAGVTAVSGGVVTGNAASPCAASPSPSASASVSPSASPSASVSPSTSASPSPTTPATMLGGDPRKDSIYFVLTARFYDGDGSNNRGGSQHTKSGNAANNDPMFRGDFKGLVDKLDYIKALGFSAVWITPVVLNRSDYDYHGYHGWDFYEVDPRLESDGASYQDLIDTAHAKGLKIYQDVVFNHSSRWGAKGLFTPTVYGVRDSQWSWYYSEKVAGKEYNPLEENATGNTYNGDLWSSTAPAGSTCPNFGLPTGAKSSEGYALYNCQWPSPTAKMFPSDLYHQCWIGNWEGEDARSCWLHEDLADFNTENATVQNYLIGAYTKYIDMGVDGFRVDTAVHIPRVTWNRTFLPALQAHLTAKYGAAKAKDFYIFGEVAAFVNDKWNRGSVNHSAQFYTWKERKEYATDDVTAAIEQFNYENNLGTGGQPTSTNAFLSGNTYHAPDHSRFSGMNIIDMRMHMNFGDAPNAFSNGKDSDDSVNDATYNTVYVDSHDYGPNKSSTRYAGGTDAWAENMTLMWTFRGIPTLYYGSEIEFKAGQKIDCGPSCPLETTGRAYYGTHLAGTVTASDFGVVGSASGAVATTLSQPLVKHLQRLNQIRRAVPALQMGQYSTEGVSGGMAYKRRYTSGSVDSFALITVSGGATFSGIPNGTYVDAVTGDTKTVTNGSLTINLNQKGNLRVYVLSQSGNPAPGKVGADTTYLQ
ncbi:putative glycosyl hydrolase [Actinoplanes missouriensis 431]|uniref:Putative glycosyl hydrolase n=1 Tax=Actinoplanes missouriensis (strain ATCC 14538 / DSM 43046 / CBS 188.64 / JCM 3121 / NBRC 102363 / NCIMB 12654 / NRRL B-3342 / UNCC 431) TaxID=512565 RepID=I0HFD6_ACTM4|nr:carbohydrate binding domain-containing protein [Actinoplanes missouriensis]BAL91723.1 putative glycosyl hydrolase [Actinoplanes missouriensis 431]